MFGDATRDARFRALEKEVQALSDRVIELNTLLIRLGESNLANHNTTIDLGKRLEELAGVVASIAATVRLVWGGK